MLKVTGTVINIFKAPEGVGKDGKAYGGETKVQLQGEVVLKNSETRIQVLTLTARHPEQFRLHLGKVVQADIAAFVSGKDVAYYLPENGHVQAAP